MGPVGAGKSTLCYALNGAIPHAVEGELGGTVSVLGLNTRDVSMGDLAERVGLMFENVEEQLFNATVADEVAFGLESLGLTPDEIERRIEKALELVGLGGFRERAPRALSGGEQKRLALASVLAMRPELLVLDEPTLGLDPLARRNVISAIDRLRRRAGSGMTVVMATQDVETAARFADRIVVLREGLVALSGATSEVLTQVDRLREWGLAVPQLAELAHALGKRAGRPCRFFRPDEAREALKHGPVPRPMACTATGLSPARAPLVEIEHLSYRYPAAETWALADCTLQVARGEWLAVVGINGSGKSTLLKHLNGLLKPSLGSVRVGGRDTRDCQVGELARTVGYLPQNPDHLIFSTTVRREIAYGPCQLGLEGKALDRRVEDMLDLLDLAPYAAQPPAVLGYGLRRKVALASVLAMGTPLLALDEPAVGLDWGTTRRLLDTVAALHARGTTVVMITHDLGWVARYAERVIVLYGGRVAAQGVPRQVLADVERLRAVDLDPLPVTALGDALHWPRPLPVTAEDVLARIGAS